MTSFLDDEARDYSEILLKLYATAAEPAGWKSIASLLASCFDSESAFIQRRDTRKEGVTNLSWTENFSESAMKLWNEHYYKLDLWVARRMRNPQMIPFLGNECVPEDEYAKGELYNDLSKDMGVFHLVGSVFPVAGPDEIVAIGIHRPEKQSNFGVVEKRRLKVLLPHFEQAIQLADRLSWLRQIQNVSATSSQALGVGALIVSMAGKVLFADRTAETLLRARKGLAQKGGQLCAEDPNLDAKLKTVIRQAALAAQGASLRPGRALMVSRREEQVLSLLICPLPDEAVGGFKGEIAAVVFIRDLETQALSPSILQDLFGFTPAQASVAARLADGNSLDQIAAKLRISHHTARDHLKQIFAKTGTTRQPQLVALLLRSVAALGS